MIQVQELTGVELLCASADTLLDNLTVEEMLMYTAEMKNPVRESLATKKAKVALVLEQLALTSCRNVKIGNALDRGISGSSPGSLQSQGHDYCSDWLQKGPWPMSSPRWSCYWHKHHPPSVAV